MPPRLVLRVFLAAFLAAATALAQPPSAIFAQVDQMVAALSEITGWPVRRKVPSEMLTKERFRHFVEASTKDSSHDKDTRAEEITLKMFGLVPQDFNLARETVDLLSEQAAAFYDYNKKRLFILDSTTEAAEQRLALVHELAHALADQQHPLGKYLHRGNPDDDASTAREAVMEGQATWLTWAYESKRAGGKPEVPRRVLDTVTKDDDTSSAEFPVLSSAPLYLRESLLFPYSAGMTFQDEVFHRLGRAGFDGVFTRPPRSTQQILHLDAYVSGKMPTDPEPPSLAPLAGKDAARFRMLADGSVGEFDHSVLLRQYVGEQQGVEAASHWRGGAFRLYEHKRDKYPVLAYASEWDSPEAARVYFELYQRVLKGKWKKMEVSERSDAQVSGAGDNGRFQVRLSGALVQSIEGLR
jgi:hypothetical protein